MSTVPPDERRWPAEFGCRERREVMWSEILATVGGKKPTGPAAMEIRAGVGGRRCLFAHDLLQAPCREKGWNANGSYPTDMGGFSSRSALTKG
jgi:hypothetical protein